MLAINLGSETARTNATIRHGESNTARQLISWARALLAVALAWILLQAANWAVRDCSTGPDASENCLWLGVRRRFGWPQSKLLRAGVLEAAGLAVLAGLYLTFRYIWPRRRLLRSRDNIEPAETNS